MAKNLAATRRELLEQWRAIEDEEEDGDDGIDPSKRRRLHSNKEQWYSCTVALFGCSEIERKFWFLALCEQWIFCLCLCVNSMVCTNFFSFILFPVEMFILFIYN